MGVGATSWKKVTIASGAALSGALNIQGYRVIALAQPADCEGTSFGAQVPNPANAQTFTALSRDIREATGAAPVTAAWEVMKSATVAQVIMLDEVDRIVGFDQVKIQSQDGSGGATNQTVAAADVYLLLEEIGRPLGS